ncbi:hypothetical protein H9X96_01975 [Pedobacter sp. N36a]|uniref:tetratricopeptide repeat protein n=1 Tax=Pedobacter sp. N36a TaxID=2767996 RepID=UPI00165763E1|nr:tetratricopeptide repeat protein [Pedobacter sp. N36a]MBC8984541.1 hypothetical protein [Pedobacter sp. N36a]
MKSFQNLFSILLLSALTLCSASCNSRSAYEDWKARAKTDIRLLPKYSGVVKSQKYLKIDEQFIKEATEQFGTKERASYVYSRWGMEYAKKGDPKTAMYRLNQAWLLDPKNAEAYHGFGYVMAGLGAFKEALNEYHEGLKFAPENEQMKIERAAVQQKL